LLRKPSAEHDAFATQVRRELQLCGDWKAGAAVVEPNLELRRAKVRANHQTILSAAKDFRPDVVIAGNLDFVGHFFVQELLNQGTPVGSRRSTVSPVGASG
jgi:hypothetical protein